MRLQLHNPGLQIMGHVIVEESSTATLSRATFWSGEFGDVRIIDWVQPPF